MKSKRNILTLVISALLTAGVASYSMSSYPKEEEKEKDEKGDKSDSDKRSDSGSGDKSKQKITICHVPPGDPDQMHTIHIAFSAWKAHQKHTNNKGPDYADYLGSCNNPPITTPPTTTTEALHVISGCTGTYRDTLLTKVHSYYEPITVADTVLDDKDDGEAVITAMSQCLDNGDSSDSGKSKSKSGGKGQGHDSVSDSGKHHRIRGCQNKDTTQVADSSDSSKHGSSDSDKNDTNKNYHKKLKDADRGYDTANHIKDPIVVSDSSLDDKDVWKEYKECAKDSSDSKKLDSSKTGKQKGDSGHKQHILRVDSSNSDSGKQHYPKSCEDKQLENVKVAVAKYNEKASTRDIILTETSYKDVWIEQAVKDCVNEDKGKGKDTETTSSTGVSGRLNFREITTPQD